MSETPASAESHLTGERRRLIAFAVALAALLGVGFWWTAYWMGYRWMQPNSYYSHGWLIPPASAVLLYMRRRELLSCPVRPSAWGLALLAPSLLLHLLGTAWQVGFFTGFAFLGVAAGLIWTLLGPAVLRVALFPIAFLAFMIPVPEVLLETVSFKLKLAAAALATQFIGLLGLAGVREGSYVHLPSGTVVVDDVCSGLKYLISLTAFGALYAYISSLRGWRKLALFLAAIPIAFVANVCRVILLLLIAYKWGPEKTESWYSHDVLGFALFAFAFCMLFAVEALLLGEREEPASADQQEAPAGQRERPSRSLSGTVLTLMALAAAASLHVSWPRQTVAAGEILASVPRSMDGWQGSAHVLDERVYEVLGTRDVLSRRYVNGRQERVDLLVVLAHQVRRRTHPPEQCISGEGRRIAASQERLVELPGSGPTLRVRELIVDRGETRSLVWYFFKSGPELNISYWRHQAGVALRKLAEPDAADVLIMLDGRVAGGDLDAARAVHARFLARSFPVLMDRLP